MTELFRYSNPQTVWTVFPGWYRWCFPDVLQHSNFSMFLGVAIGEECRFSQEYADVHPTLLGCVCTDKDWYHTFIFYWDNLPQVSLDWEIAYFDIFCCSGHETVLESSLPFTSWNFCRQIKWIVSRENITSSFSFRGHTVQTKGPRAFPQVVPRHGAKHFGFGK